MRGQWVFLMVLAIAGVAHAQDPKKGNLGEDGKPRYGERRAPVAKAAPGSASHRGPVRGPGQASGITASPVPGSNGWRLTETPAPGTQKPTVAPR